MNDFEVQQHDGETSKPQSQLAVRDYVRFVALGDSASCGVGDPTPGGWRGWARVLADAIAADHHVSFCKHAIPSATVAEVPRQQLTEALDHRPVIASAVVGVNDAMRSSWDPEQIRQDLLHCAGTEQCRGSRLCMGLSVTAPRCDQLQPATATPCSFPSAGCFVYSGL